MSFTQTNLYYHQEAELLKSNMAADRKYRLEQLRQAAHRNPKLLTNMDRQTLEREFPDEHFPWMDWDGEDFN